MLILKYQGQTHFILQIHVLKSVLASTLMNTGHSDVTHIIQCRNIEWWNYVSYIYGLDFTYSYLGSLGSICTLTSAAITEKMLQAWLFDSLSSPGNLQVINIFSQWSFSKHFKQPYSISAEPQAQICALSLKDQNCLPPDDVERNVCSVKQPQ